MPHFTITPAGSSSPTVVLYEDSLEIEARTQRHQVERHGVIEGGTPASDSDGLEPGVLPIHGFWLGTEAESIATRLIDDFLDDPSVERVDLQAVNDNGTNVSSPHNGTYRLSDDEEVRQRVGTEAECWEYRLRLTED